MATTAEILAKKQARQAALEDRLMELDAMPLEEQQRIDWQEEGRSVPFSVYRASLGNQLRELEESIERITKNDTLINGPYTKMQVVRG